MRMYVRASVFAYVHLISSNCNCLILIAMTRHRVTRSNMYYLKKKIQLSTSLCRELNDRSIETIKRNSEHLKKIPDSKNFPYVILKFLLKYSLTTENSLFFLLFMARYVLRKSGIDKNTEENFCTGVSVCRLQLYTNT